MQWRDYGCGSSYYRGSQFQTYDTATPINIKLSKTIIILHYRLYRCILYLFQLTQIVFQQVPIYYFYFHSMHHFKDLLNKITTNRVFFFQTIQMIREPQDYPQVNGNLYPPYQRINNNNIRSQSMNISVANQYPSINSNMQSRNYQLRPVQVNRNYSLGNSTNNPNQNPPASIFREAAPNQPLRHNQLQIIAQQRLYKMDGIFAQSINSLRKQYIIHTIIVFLLLLGIVLLYKFDFFKSGNQGYSHGVILYDGQLKQSVLPFLFLAESLIILFKLIIYFKTYNKVNFALQTAKLIGHGVRTEIADSSKSLQENTSDVYLLISTEITYDQGMDSMTKTLHKEITENQIRVCSKNSICCTTQLHELFEFGMFICGIYLIIVLAQDQTTYLQKVLLIITIVYWFLQNYKIIVYTLVLLLCPLIVIGLIVFACCCSSDQRREFTVPEAITPTNEQIINCGGTCSICMMQFTPTSSVIILPCSNKHMFHEMCINAWLQVKTTCPNCRFDLAAV